MDFLLQFLQVQTVLQATGEEGQEDLVKIRDDLVELIHISEGTEGHDSWMSGVSESDVFLL